MFFDSWQGVLRVVMSGSLAYVSLVALLRIAGNRTLSKMNAFDLVVTVALGSPLATIVLNSDVALVEGVAAFATLIALHFIITWASVRSSTISGWVKSEPLLLAYNGHLLPDRMRTARVVEAEVLAAIREHGRETVDQIAAVVLETDGTFSVLATRESAQHAPRWRRG